jgi:hypothetical protein
MHVQYVSRTASIWFDLVEFGRIWSNSFWRERPIPERATVRGETWGTRLQVTRHAVYAARGQVDTFVRKSSLRAWHEEPNTRLLNWQGVIEGFCRPLCDPLDARIISARFWPNASSQRNRMERAPARRRALKSRRRSPQINVILDRDARATRWLPFPTQRHCRTNPFAWPP